MADVYALLGYPGTGKYTVAHALAAELRRRGRRAQVVDNHFVNNPIFEVVLADGLTPIPARVWELVEQVRDAVLCAIEECAPADCDYIFTNFVRAAEAELPLVRDYFARLARLAEARGGRLRIASLRCAGEELLRRVGEPGRRERHKSTDVSWVAGLLADHPVHEPAGEHCLVLDVTNLPPPDAAHLIANA